jgi:hypothetical protein
MAANKKEGTKNLVVISDTHIGCQMGLCPPEGVRLDEGGTYEPNKIQQAIWEHWLEFWDWVNEATRGEPYALVLNGDAIDGVHHGSTTQWSHNLADQAEAAYEILAPRVAGAEAYFHIRGTEAHVGPSGVEEERLAKMLGAVPCPVTGKYARYEMWAKVGGALAHIMHHIGTTSSAAHESSAVNRELVAEYVEAARWGEEAPDYVIRSHRHRSISVEINGHKGLAAGIVTPGWQGKTPFVYRIAGGRLSPVQVGGIVIRQGDVEHYHRRFLRHLKRQPVEIV